MIAQFALLLIGGMSLMWCLMPRRQVTSGFFRIQMLITLGLAVLVALSDHSAAWPRLRFGLAVAMAVVSFVGSVLWTLERRRAGSAMVFLVAGLAVASLLIPAKPWSPETTLLLGLEMLSDLSTAAVLGGAVTGMLLGHWYLTAPTMSTAPLSRLTWFFGVALVLRLILSLVGFALGWQQLTGPTQWTWFALRWLAGIVAPLVICVMAAAILRYRNTQAATGVLFAGVILTFIGELSAFLLSHELHTPL